MKSPLTGQEILENFTLMLVTTPTSSDLTNKIALEGCLVPVSRRFGKGKFHCTSHVNLL